MEKNSTKTISELWVEEFDKSWKSEEIKDRNYEGILIKSFIHSLVQKTKAEATAELKEKIIGELEKMKKDGWDNFGKKDLTEKEEGFNQAISEAVENIKKV